MKTVLTDMRGIQRKLIVVISPDDDASPDTDRLMFSYSPEQVAAWKRDEWHFVGVRARLVIHDWNTGVTKTIETAGLWHVEDFHNAESDAHHLEIADQEFAVIADELTEQEKAWIASRDSEMLTIKHES